MSNMGMTKAGTAETKARSKYSNSVNVYKLFNTFLALNIYITSTWEKFENNQIVRSLKHWKTRTVNTKLLI